MRLNTLGLTTAVVASLVILSACNKPANAPPAPVASAAIPTATPVAPVGANPTAAPAPSGAPMAGGNKGPKLRIVCADDIKKFCSSGEKPGKCLKAHESDLSQACQTARAERKAARRARTGETG